MWSERIHEILDLIAKGYNLNDLGKLYGIAPNNVNAGLKKAGTSFKELKAEYCQRLIQNCLH